MMQSDMNSVVGDDVVDNKVELARLEAVWGQIESGLEAEKTRIVDEISNYPHPIPACDAQFNALLEERAAVLAEIGQVKGIRKQGLPLHEQRQLLDDFEQSLRFLDGIIKGGALTWGAPGV